MNNIKLPLALDTYTNKLIHISEITKEDVKDYNFVCPACKTELITRMGEKNVHHFAHKVNCDISGESITHLLAKKVVSESSKMVFPIYNPVTLEWQEIEHEYTFVESEVMYEDVIPDIVIKVEDRLIFIEIANTHFIDDEKLQKLKRIGTETWEISVGADMFFNYELLADSVLNGTWNKKSVIMQMKNYKEYLNDKCIELSKINVLYNSLCKQYKNYKTKKVTIEKEKKFPLEFRDNYFRLRRCDCELEDFEYWFDDCWINVVVNPISDNLLNVYIYEDVSNLEGLNSYWCGVFIKNKKSYSYRFISQSPRGLWSNLDKPKINELYELIQLLLNKKVNNLQYDKYNYGYSLYTPIISEVQ